MDNFFKSIIIISTLLKTICILNNYRLSILVLFADSLRIALFVSNLKKKHLFTQDNMPTVKCASPKCAAQWILIHKDAWVT